MCQNVSNCKRLPLFQSGKPPSTEIRYGKYPLEMRSKSNPLSKKVLVVQAFAYGKYLGNLTADFDDNGDLTSWSGNPKLLDNSVAQDPTVLGQVQQWKAEVTKVSEVRSDDILNYFLVIFASLDRPISQNDTTLYHWRQWLNLRQLRIEKVHFCNFYYLFNHWFNTYDIRRSVDNKVILFCSVLFCSQTRLRNLKLIYRCLTR